MKAANILETIGNTPHIRINRLFGDAEVWVKSERSNPGASIKDRIALADDRGCRAERRAAARRHDHRADLRQYRHRPRHGRRGEGLQTGPGHAREHEPRAPPADALLRRDLRSHPARKGHEGRDRPRRGTDRRDAEQLDAAAIRESRQSRGPPPHHRAGDPRRFRATARSTCWSPASARAATSPPAPRC